MRLTKVLYTNTKEGKEVLDTLENIISTEGMEVYECDLCEELFAGRPNEVDEEHPVCAECQLQIDVSNYDPNELKVFDEED